MGCRNSRATKTDNSTVSVKDMKKDQNVQLKKREEIKDDKTKGKTRATEEDRKKPDGTDITSF